jgi:guanyl-specific ribonuclease Sa
MQATTVRRWLRILILAAIAAVAFQAAWRGDRAANTADHEATAVATGGSGVDSQAPAWLPPEALETLALIEARGPFPYDRDGTVFQNRERRLPERPRGHYREYTVPTPGSPDRGARRIVTGGEPPDEFYYTDDHYRTFRRIDAGER